MLKLPAPWSRRQEKARFYRSGNDWLLILAGTQKDWKPALKAGVTGWKPVLRAALIAAVAGQALAAGAVTFTNNTLISFDNSNYEGQDIVITNCTVTVDGSHLFADVHLLFGGVLTHSFSPNGRLTNEVLIVDEPHVLSSTNPPTLNQPGALTNTVVVKDSTGVTNYALGTDYTLLATNGSLAIIYLAGSSIPDGATILVTYGILAFANTGLNLTVTNNFQIEAGGAIDASGQGDGGGIGPGAGATAFTASPYPYYAGGGGGYGGSGGASSSLGAGGICYGAVSTPSDKGSGGGAGSGIGGAGGGAVILSVSGLLRVDGQIAANGALGVNAHSGGGSGGSIQLSAQTFSGAGTISAVGGGGDPYDGGGGGGGRVAIHYGTNQFAGSLAAQGGAGAVIGGAGTIYTRANSSTVGQMMIDNGGQAGARTTLSNLPLVDLTVSGGAVGAAAPNILETFGSLMIGSNSWLTLITNFAGATSLRVMSNATIQAGGGITLDGEGYFGGQGYEGGGAGGTANSPYGQTGGGGANGGPGGVGLGGARGGIAYGSITQPSLAGSGGGGEPLTGGGAGGGALSLAVNGALRLDGAITANGAAGISEGGGGGAGGSLWLSIGGQFLGSGVISANGGGADARFGGGGGGGRIEIVSGTNAFTGAVSAHGGNGYASGGAGTVYTQTGSSLPQLIIDNGGAPGPGTPLSSLNFPVSLTISGGAVAVPGPQWGGALVNLLIASNSWLAYSNVYEPALTISSNTTIQADGGILADGQGSPGGQGQAPGATEFGVGGGGGYGGAGGSGGTNFAHGGTISYGSLSSPNSPGSGGGGGAGNPSLGGAGGGVLHVSVTGTLDLEGQITANGYAGPAQGSGGGSGGSVWLTAGLLSGAGLISANGGAGDAPLGGGGGGGRIAIYFNTNRFTGSIAAHGGAGANNGGAGTIFFQSRLNEATQVTVDNGGLAAQIPTTLSGYQFFSLTLSGGAVVTPGSQTIGPLVNLFIMSNSWLTYSNTYYSATLTVNSNATIQAGGGILLDGSGSLPGQGQGAGQGEVGAGGGGGYGGYGGAGATNLARGGAPYGSITQPTLVGSGGGIATPGVQGSSSGAGGGALELSVNGTLELDGLISANGNPAFGPGWGGGSGGGLMLSLGKLLGAGAITANGGAGDMPLGGGGGGGRVAIFCATNSFTGSVAAHGGAGANNGGAGTIYLQARTPYPAPSQVIVDNGGLNGQSPTPLSGLERVNLTINGGATATPGPQFILLNLLISSNSWLTYSNFFSPGTTAILSVSSNATIQNGSGILLDGTGYPPGKGPGAGMFLVSGVGGGGGYGGNGGPGASNNAAGGAANGSISEPASSGSGGGGPYITGNPYVSGGSGGGALELDVGGTLALDGKISANGSTGFAYGSGGGAGGGLWLTAGRIIGAGIVSANGGAGDPLLGGGGGGGRIALYYTSNLFTGTLSAQGGSGANYGGAGTVYLTKNGGNAGQLIVDNGGPRGTNTPLLQLQNLSSLTISGGAVATASSEVIGNLLINSNSSLISSGIGLSLTVSSNATVLAGGAISVDGQGNGVGPGAGNYSFSETYGYTGGGGGYGGNGGNSLSGALGGSANGVIGPGQGLSAGSGGGGYPEPGPAGGGRIALMVGNALVVNGAVSANGGGAISEGNGGGSGGGISLIVGSLSGTGSISANGGPGDARYGGGGGGGRIVLNYVTNQFAGSVSAHGGPGANYGGAGTIYYQMNGNSPGQLVVDNGGPKGAATPLSSAGVLDLSVADGAVVYPPTTGLVLNSLALNSGASMIGGIEVSNALNPPYTITLTVLGNASVGSNASIAVDGQGYSGDSGGPGEGQMVSNGSGSGGGYGGAGGASASGAPGGVTYGSAAQPTNWGSRGGVFEYNWKFSQGGGAMRLMVASNLTVNGALTVNGNPAILEGSGGGSGGSIWVTAREIDGNGGIFANGGPGYAAQGGGGGGGRIAIYTRTNNFAGTIAVLGGAGASPGQNGTIVTTNIPFPQVAFQAPSGIVSYAVSNVVLTFGSPMNFGLVSGANVIVDTPNGELPPGSAAVSPLSLYGLQIGFPAQTDLGYYDVQAGPQIFDIYGLPLAPTYIGSFIILPPIISGQVTDTNGQPVPYVTMNISSESIPSLTDANGLYSVEVLPSWTGTITPSKGEAMFIPQSRGYVNVSGNLTNQNFVMVSPVALALTAQCQGTNMNLCWYGIHGVAYQTLYSTDLVNWLPYGGPVMGTNGMTGMTVPVGNQPAMYFRFSTSY